MYGIEIINELVGDIIDTISAINKGKKRWLIEQAGGELLERALDTVKYCREVNDNLIYITNELSNGVKLTSDSNNNIILEYEDGNKIIFDCRVKTNDVWVSGMDIYIQIIDIRNLDNGDNDKM